MIPIHQLINPVNVEPRHRFKPFYTKDDGGDDTNRRKLIEKIRGQALENSGRSRSNVYSLSFLPENVLSTSDIVYLHQVLRSLPNYCVCPTDTQRYTYTYAVRGDGYLARERNNNYIIKSKPNLVLHNDLINAGAIL